MQLYDTAAGSFSSLGVAAEFVFSLPDKRVLLLSTGAIPLIYEPDTGTVSNTGSQTVTIPNGSSVTMLSDGRVLIAGGYSSSAFVIGVSKVYDTAYLFDPATGMTLDTGRMSIPRGFHTSSLLADGTVISLAGYVFNDQTLLHTGPGASAESYSPKNGQSKPIGSLSAFRQSFSVTRLCDRDGTLLITGGSDGGSTIAETEIYESGRQQFFTDQSYAMISRRANHSAILLSDCRVLVTGGSYRFAAGLTSVQSSAELWQ